MGPTQRYDTREAWINAGLPVCACGETFELEYIYMRIKIVVEGGVVQAVLCDEDADVEIIDKDDAETPKSQRQTQARIDMLADEMIEVN